MKMPVHEVMMRFVYEVNGQEVFGEWANMLDVFRSWLTPNEHYKSYVKRVEVERIDARFGG